MKICIAHNSVTRWANARYSMRTRSRSNWNLPMLVLGVRVKPESQC